MFPIFAGNSASTGYNLTRSLRFRSSATAYLNRTPASATNRQIWTWSGWVKRGSLGVYSPLFIAGTSNGQQVGSLAFSSAGGVYDKLELNFGVQGTSTEFWLQTTQVFRDPSAWYHIVCAVDTTQATASNRVKFYVNGAQITALAAYSTYSQYPSQNYNTSVNNTVQHLISRDAVNTAGYFDGYLAEVNFIDGQALTPSSFGSTNSLTGVWQPAAYTGTYGTNGFYLPFTDNSALTTSSNVGLGKDFSGNGNYWTTNNISITAGVTYDSMTDVPTLTSATAANFAVLNPLINKNSNPGTFTNGNLVNTANSNSSFITYGTIAIDSSFPKIYWEVKNVVQSADTNYPLSGIANIADTQTASIWFLTSGQGVGYYASGTVYNGGTNLGSFTAPNTGTVMFAYDPATGKFWVGTGGVWQNSGNPAAGTGQIATLATTNSWLPVTSCATSGTQSATNFGQQPFQYTPPTGFVALNTFNLPTSTIVKGNTVFDATIWTGADTATSRSFSGLAFKPDFWWNKPRSQAYSNLLYDSVRGAGSTKELSSNSTAAEGGTNAATYGYLSSFDSNGVTWTRGSAGSGTNPDGYADYDESSATYVAWAWQAGQGSTSSNTNGTITSTVSVNASAGFSVVTYTGNAVNGATVGHGLGVAPQFIIVKVRNQTGYQWPVYHKSIGATNWLALEATQASAANSVLWNNTEPTSSVFSLGTTGYVNAAYNYVAYCWTSIAGFSAFGSYTGNGSSDGTFVYTGFRPKFVMMKSTGTGDWWIYDTSRSTYNAAILYLYADTSAAEFSDATEALDILSNGFKLRVVGNYNPNTNGQSFIYMAFAENPFKNSLAR